MRPISLGIDYRYLTLRLDQESLALNLDLDSFELDLAQAGHFLQKFGMKDSKGRITAKDINLNLSDENFNVSAGIQIDKFKTVYIDGDKPVTLTFDKLEPVKISHNLKDKEIDFKGDIHFHKLAYSYGTYLFNSSEIKSKVHFNLGANSYATDSVLTGAYGQVDGSDIKSLSTVDLKLNWSEGDLQEYSAKGKFDISYSRKFH